MYYIIETNYVGPNQTQESNSNGYTLDSDLEGFMQKRRQELRDELEDGA